jgi:hypothetical protein
MHNFYISVLSKKEDCIKLKFKIIWSEQKNFSKEKNFALQAIWHKKKLDEKSAFPLYKQISSKKITDKFFTIGKSSQFIISSTIIGTKNFPQEQLLAGFFR